MHWANSPKFICYPPSLAARTGCAYSTAHTPRLMRQTTRSKIYPHAIRKLLPHPLTFSEAILPNGVLSNTRKAVRLQTKYQRGKKHAFTQHNLSLCYRADT